MNSKIPHNKNFFWSVRLPPTLCPYPLPLTPQLTHPFVPFRPLFPCISYVLSYLANLLIHIPRCPILLPFPPPILSLPLPPPYPFPLYHFLLLPTLISFPPWPQILSRPQVLSRFYPSVTTSPTPPLPITTSFTSNLSLPFHYPSLPSPLPPSLPYSLPYASSTPSLTASLNP